MKKLLFLLVTVLVSCMSGAQNTQVTLSCGVAEGSVSNGIYVYKGIPYAKAERMAYPYRHRHAAYKHFHVKDNIRKAREHNKGKTA